MSEQYQTIARTLMKEIAEGLHDADSPFPKRAELASRFRVTRSTIDRSIGVLVGKGLLESRQGSGTYLVRDRVPHSAAFIVGRPASGPDLRSPSCRFDLITEETLADRSSRNRLGRYEGLLWWLPSLRALSWAGETEGRLPQIVINRHSIGLNHVSTAHGDAIRGITAERLSAVPDAQPVFLRPPRVSPDPVASMREDGFVEACGAAGRFYEVLEMPEGFGDKIRILEDRLGARAGRTLILVSSGIAQTGAVMAWVRQRELAWRRDVWYSDFDDDEDVLTWGVWVTSFLQDYRRLFELGAEKLAALIEGREAGVRIVVPPLRVDGDT